MIAKILANGAVVLLTCLGSTATAHGNPSAFGALSCGCREAALPGSPASVRAVNDGIRQGLASVPPGAPVQ